MNWVVGELYLNKAFYFERGEDTWKEVAVVEFPLASGQTLWEGLVPQLPPLLSLLTPSLPATNPHPEVPTSPLLPPLLSQRLVPVLVLPSTKAPLQAVPHLAPCSLPVLYKAAREILLKAFLPDFLLLLKRLQWCKK